MAITALYSTTDGVLDSAGAGDIFVNPSAVVGDLLLLGIVTDLSSNTVPTFPSVTPPSGDPNPTLLRNDTNPTNGFASLVYSMPVTSGLLSGLGIITSEGGLVAWTMITVRNATTVLATGEAASSTLTVTGPTVTTSGSGLYVANFFSTGFNADFGPNPALSNTTLSTLRIQNDANTGASNGPQIVSTVSDTLGFSGSSYAVGNMTYSPTTINSQFGSMCQTIVVAPATPPGAPTGVVAADAHKGATVSWTPPVNNGGQAVTGYTITPSTGGPVTVGNVTSVVISGLAVGVSVTFTVKAINAQGAGTASSASNPVWPTSNNMNGLVF